MFTSLRKLTKSSLADYELSAREDWVTEHPSQVSSSIDCDYFSEILRVSVYYNAKNQLIFLPSQL